MSVSAPCTITGEQRDLLYEDVLHRLSGIGDVWLAVCAKNYEAAGRLGRAYSDELRLVTEDLGWGDNTPAEVIELKTPPDVLRRALARMGDGALRFDASEEAEREELRESQERNRLLAETCQRVLEHLDREQ